MSTATASMNGTASASKAASSNGPNSSSRQQLKTASGGKASEGARNQAGSPVDASTRYVRFLAIILLGIGDMCFSWQADTSTHRKLGIVAPGSSLPGNFMSSIANLPSLHSKKSSAPKAWTQGNPLVQRSTTPNTANGTPNGSIKTNAAPKPSQNASPESSSADKHAHDRLLFLVTNFTVRSPPWIH